MTLTTTTASTTGTACKHLAAQIKMLKAEIKAKEHLIATQTARVEVLLQAPHPDTKTIHRIQANIQGLEHDLEDDRKALEILEDEFRMRCGG
jgi:predicted RNase H-like nuclease (RuvC/YqgF family)